MLKRSRSTNGSCFLKIELNVNYTLINLLLFTEKKKTYDYDLAVTFLYCKIFLR